EATPELLEGRRLNRRPCSRQLRIDQRCGLVPYPRIILDFVVGLIENPDKPLIVVAIDSTVPIRHSNVTKDLRPRWISRDNCRASMEQTSWLIKIDRRCYVRGDRGIFLAWLGNTIHLDREQDRDTMPPQLSG